MPIYLSSGENHFCDADPKCLDIGLVNNMPDSALAGTERQFRSLLEAASGSMVVRLTFYAMPDVPRSDAGRRYVSSYRGLDDLWDRPLDGLIVTGTEPHAADLTEEPYWTSLTKLLQWAERNTFSTVWSCLAAHAAVLHIDGVQRRRLDVKRFGVFDCKRVHDHHLTTGAPRRWRMPHSRWNELPEDALRSSGYCVLTRSADAGVDAFVKQRNSLFVFFQGHPEYGAVTLLREYRRDIQRFLRRESDTYPPMPQGYFDHETLTVLSALRERALAHRQEEVMKDFPDALAAGSIANTWSTDAVRIYRNWLTYMAGRKSRELKAKPFGASGHK
jgi:homoserine O-succinyltransferase/O-acetyltransferase